MLTRPAQDVAVEIAEDVTGDAMDMQNTADESVETVS